MGSHFSLRTICLADCDTAAFLSSVLQCKQSIINGRRYISSIKIIHSKDTTFLMQIIPWCIFFKLVVIHIIVSAFPLVS